MSCSTQELLEYILVARNCFRQAYIQARMTKMHPASVPLTAVGVVLFACVNTPTLVGAQGCHLASDCAGSGHCTAFLDYLTCIAQDKQVFGIDGSGMCEQYGKPFFFPH